MNPGCVVSEWNEDGVQAKNDLGHTLPDRLLVLLRQIRFWQDLIDPGPAAVPHLGFDALAEFGLDLEQVTAEAFQKEPV